MALDEVRQPQGVRIRKEEGSMDPMSVCILSVVLGYLLGSLSPANWIAAAKGRDIRKVGNGNAGASNVTMSFGLKYGAAVAAFDILKGFLAVSLARAACPVPEAMYAAGAAAVMGHVFPAWTGFRRGGKGFAAYIGITLGFDWRACLVLACVGLLLVLLSDRIVAATFTFVLCVPAGLWLAGRGAVPVLCAGSASLLILVLHRGNVRRILDGTEPKVSTVLRGRKGVGPE